MNQFWQPRQLRQDEENTEERRATWLELFYDLVFVAAISQVSHYLSAHLSWSGLISFVVFLVPLWWCWVGATFYATRFDTDDLFDRIITLLQMAVVTAMAVNMYHGLEKASANFALCYALFRGILVVQYLNAGYHVPVARGLTNWYVRGFGASVLFWFISIFVPTPWRYLFWLFGLIIDFSTPLTAGKLIAKIPPSMTHIPERVGLFTIIVLGESVISVVTGLAELQWSLVSVFNAFLGLTLAFCFWWLYFDSSDSSALESMKEGKMSIALTWLYAHIPLTIGLAATGVAIKHIIMNPANIIPEHGESLLFCCAVALCLVTLSLIHYLNYTLGSRKCRKIISVYRLFSAAFILVLGFAHELIPSLILITLVTLACVFQIGLDLWREQTNIKQI